VSFDRGYQVVWGESCFAEDEVLVKAFLDLLNQRFLKDVVRVYMLYAVEFWVVRCCLVEVRL
jgi:hypothetical protein